MFLNVMVNAANTQATLTLTRNCFAGRYGLNTADLLRESYDYGRSYDPPRV